ncbi:hypothetical protein D3C71_1819850 [compost metagenome]
MGLVGLRECGLPRAAQHGLQAGLQLLHIEGFGDVVVCPCVESEHAVLHTVARCENQHRKARDVAACPGQKLHAIGPRKTQIQDDAVHRLRLQNRHGLRHAGRCADAVFLLFELACQCVEQQGVVFDN